MVGRISEMLLSVVPRGLHACHARIIKFYLVTSRWWPSKKPTKFGEIMQPFSFTNFFVLNSSGAMKTKIYEQVHRYALWLLTYNTSIGSIISSQCLHFLPWKPFWNGDCRVIDHGQPGGIGVIRGMRYVNTAVEEVGLAALKEAKRIGKILGEFQRLVMSGSAGGRSE